MSVKAIPDGYHTITPYLIVEDAKKLIEFLEKTFDAKMAFVMKDDNGRINHAEIKIGDSMLMFSEGCEEYKPTFTHLYLYVENVDSTYKKALEAGATTVSEPVDKFYGDRSASVKDSFGNFWGIATHVKDVTEEELRKGAANA